MRRRHRRPRWVETVRGGGGDDTIIASALTAATPFPGEEWLGVGSQTFEGGPGDDVVFGERGNDTLSGNEGNDRLYGGIGDDVLRGGPGQDQLAGGHGADSIDGDAGDDYVRGDGTIDRIFDTGGGTDTLSYSTGITPGFGGDMSAFPGFPAPGGERGVRLNLGAPGQNGENGTASFGGGVDEVEGPAFERVIGTASARDCRSTRSAARASSPAWRLSSSEAPWRPVYLGFTVTFGSGRAPSSPQR